MPLNKRFTLSQIKPLYQYLRKQAENKKALKYLEVAATFSLIAIFLFFAIKPTALAISSLLGEIKSKQSATQKMTAKINNIMKAQESFSQAQEKYFILESGFPSNPNFYQVVANFYTLAQKYSLKINQLKFDLSSDNSETDNDSQVEYFKVKFSSIGEYQSSIYFINELLNNRRLIDITSVKMSQPKNNSGEDVYDPNTVNINLEANIPYSPIIK